MTPEQERELRAAVRALLHAHDAHIRAAVAYDHALTRYEALIASLRAPASDDATPF